MKFLIITIVNLFVISSCSKNKEYQPNAYFSEEKFVDSLHIGLKEKTKVEIEKFRNDRTEDNLVILNFYQEDSVWDFKEQKILEMSGNELTSFYLKTESQELMLKFQILITTDIKISYM